MCVIWQLFPFCFSPISNGLFPLSPCNLISRFPLISTSLVLRLLCLVVNIKGVKGHLPAPSPWKWCPTGCSVQDLMNLSFRLVFPFNFLYFYHKCLGIFLYLSILNLFSFPNEKNHFMYSWSETPPCTILHNNSHNNKICSYQASQNKLDSPVRKLPSLLLTGLFSYHKPDCSLPVPSCSQDSCSSSWQDQWCIFGSAVCHASGSWECSSVQVGQQGSACLQTKRDED